MADQVYRVQAPDGSVMEISGPAGASDDQIAAFAAANFKPKSPAKPLEIGRLEAPSGLSGFDRFLVGFPNLAQNTWLGTKQMLGIGDQKKLEADIRAQRQVLDPVASSGAGLLGNVVGGAATLAPTMFIPGANTMTGAAAVGAVTGATQPVLDGESRAVNTAIGTGASMAGQGVANLIGRAVRPVQSQLTPERQAALGVLDAAGVPTNVAQRTGSKAMANVNAAMDNLPLTAGPQQAIRDAQQGAFNRAVGRTFGVDATALTDDVIRQARGDIGQRFTDLSARNALDTNASTLVPELANLQGRVNKFETGDVSRVVRNYIDEILAKVDGNGQIPGEAYRKLDSAIGKQMRSASGDMSSALGDLQRILRDSMDQSITPADQSAWREARGLYKNMLTVGKNAERSPVGDVSPSTLLTTVRANPSTQELQDLAKAGKAILPGRVGDSGTAQRLMYQGLLTGSTLGSGLLSGQDAETTGALTAASLLGPRAAQLLINSPATQRYLTQGYLQGAVPAQIGSAGAQMLRTAPLGLLNYRDAR